MFIYKQVTYGHHSNNEHRKKRCHKCNILIISKENLDSDLSFLCFNLLEGKPYICEKCLFTLLTGEHKDWIENAKKYIDKRKEED